MSLPTHPPAEPLPVNQKKYTRLWIFWLSILILTFLFLVLIKDILLPFSVALIFAYLLNPAAHTLEAKGWSRSTAVLFILSVFFTCLLLIILFLVPVIYNQLSSLLHTVPFFVEKYKMNVMPFLNEWKDTLDPSFNGSKGMNMAFASEWVLQWGGRVLTSFVKSSLSFVNIASLIFISPILLFYTLRDWNKMIKTLKDLLPSSHTTLICEQMYAIDQVLSGYLRGQFHVCLFLSFFYSLFLMITGLHYSLFIGCATGFLAFMPYVGFLFGFVTSLVLGLLQYGPDFFHISSIVAVFMGGQVLEGNFITPKLVGEKVGLHPVWIIFGLLVGGTLFGFVGILFAMPITAIIGVLLRFGLKEYKKSLFFLG